MDVAEECESNVFEQNTDLWWDDGFISDASLSWLAILSAVCRSWLRRYEVASSANPLG